MDNFFIFERFIWEMVKKEYPFRILEISSGDGRHGYLLKTALSFCGIQGGIVDRIVIPGSPLLLDDSIYNNVFRGDIPEASHTIAKYDFILILDLFEQTEPEKARKLLDVLQYKITKQVLILTPLNAKEVFRAYHPLVFLGLDFCYSLLDSAEGTMQAYSVFPKIAYEAISSDSVPAVGQMKKLKIAFVLPHQNLTGGMKALLQQIRYLTKGGHVVKVYFRSDNAQSAIPVWSGLTDEDYAQQVVIPTSSRYLDYMEDVDVILLGWMLQVPDFVSAEVPVVLWEQGSEMMYGDFGKALISASEERRMLHRIFRMPVHLLAISETNIAALKGVYNRDAFLFPNGVDTEFYHPAERYNDIPVILLSGNPSLAYKGFPFTFDVLRRVHAAGLRFQVKWASPIPARYGAMDFPLELFIHPPQPELARLYRNADIFLSTSLYESYPLSPLEAMASGTAVIATDCGGIRAYAVHGKNCLLCRQGDSAEMANALIRLLDSREERERLALAGRETAEAHSAQHAVRLLEDRLASIVRYGR